MFLSKLKIFEDITLLISNDIKIPSWLLQKEITFKCTLKIIFNHSLNVLKQDFDKNLILT